MTRADANLPGMVGRHPAMLEVYRLVRRAARADLPVVIVGETGTGKELVARALHALSAAAGGPFVDVNCAAVPETLAEAELFGAEQGAFTGAVRPVPGLLETADGGTLFLDEACSLSRALQAKLLRAIEQRQFRRVGGRQRRTVRFRLVSAMTQPLEQLVAAGAVRKDFAYRVAGFQVRLPPLRERRSDVRWLAEHFFDAVNANGHPPQRLDEDALRLVRRYAWPGNVRELKTLVERLRVVVEAPYIGVQDVLRQLPGLRTGLPESHAVRVALEAHHWDVTKTARALGLSRATLYRRLKQLGLSRSPEFPGVSHETDQVSHETPGRDARVP